MKFNLKCKCNECFDKSIEHSLKLEKTNYDFNFFFEHKKSLPITTSLKVRFGDNDDYIISLYLPKNFLKLYDDVDVYSCVICADISKKKEVSATIYFIQDILSETWNHMNIDLLIDQNIDEDYIENILNKIRLFYLFK